MTLLLRISGGIDAVNQGIGKLVMWLILAAVLISASNAVMRKAFDIGSNAYLEIQWYLFAAVFMLGAGYVLLCPSRPLSVQVGLQPATGECLWIKCSIMNLLIFVGGLILLVFGANVLVRGASKLALSFDISPLVVGLTIVAFGTSAPEVAVSVGAVLDGKTDIAIGNVVGSNIFNVLFILGSSALIAPLVVNSQLIRQEVPIMIGASLLLLALGLDGRLSFFDAGVLFVLLVSYTGLLIVQSRREVQAAQDEYANEIKPAVAGAWDDRMPAQLLLIGAGLAALVLGSDYLVQASVRFAKAMGVSDLIIGLTIVAAGTSLPEVATSITAAIKGERDIAVGNVVGSNTFNILGCLGLSGLVSGDLGLAMAPSLLAFDIWVMLAVALACLPVFITGREIARWEGGVFVGYYVAYMAYLVLAAQQHAALQTFSGVMLGFVVPLTVVTLVVVVIRRPAAASAP